MECSLKHYICGFNGFSQVELFLSHAEIKQESHSVDALHEQKGTVGSEKNENSETNEKLDLFFSVPQEVGTDVKLFTWSNIWSITDSGKIDCYGNRSLPVMTELLSERRDLTVSLVQTGKNVLLQDGLETVLLQDTGEVSKVAADVDHVSLVDGTRECVYGINKGAQCFEGKVQEQRGEQGGWLLCLHPITVNIDVQTVSCGFEHTLILTKHGGVFSYGSGSRGQLGHGEVTVDLLTVPRQVETFTGFSVVAIAAGGWHSTSVTDTGDVYVWGWNESGQLGLPNGTISTNSLNLEINVHHSHVQIPGNEDKESENVRKHFDSSDAWSKTVQGGIADKAIGLESGGCKRKFADVDERNSDESNLTENLDRGCDRKFADVGKGYMKNKSDQSNFMENLDKSEFMDSKSCQNIHDAKEFKLVTSSGSRRHFSDCLSQFKVDNSDCIQCKFYQDIDIVQVQTVPYGLNLPDEMFVKTASCGTRHTCILTDSGVLLTTGWNGYGQLCHGDTKGRDYLETVTFFIRKHEKVIDVRAQCWNTYVKTEKETGVL